MLPIRIPIGSVELGLIQDMSSGRPILAYEIEKSIENFTLYRVIIFCRGLDLPPGIWKSHMRFKKNHIAHLSVLEVQEGQYGL
jgi:hypothetical protein